jgi:hypothetical protein
MKGLNRSAVIGLILLLPAAVLVCLGVSGLEVPPVFNNPVIVMGGLLAALCVNLASVLRLHAEREDGHIAAVTVRIGAKLLNLMVVGLCGFLLATLLGYAFVENFRPR